MITGTIYNAGKMQEMTQRWEQKKSSGNIFKKEVKELSPEERYATGNRVLFCR